MLKKKDGVNMKKDYEKLNFTVGPVQSFDSTLEIASHQIPYFRTDSFSEVMKDNERIMKKLYGLPEGSRVVFLTGSGTSGMEAAVMNSLTSKDNVLVVNGGSFGARFVELCNVHRIPNTPIELESGRTLKYDDIKKYDNSGKYTAFLVNLHETSTGVLYDIDMISDFCKRNGLLLIVDAVSAFLADEFNAEKSGIDVVITGSQKALALAPGMSIIGMSPKALKRVESNEIESFYFDLKKYLKDGERGQTPFTPAVSVLLALNDRLHNIENSGIEAERSRIHNLAVDFRNKIKGLPVKLFAETPSNAVTALYVSGDVTAEDIFTELKDKYDIFVCPNGGEMKKTVFRVGHIGNLTPEDNSILVDAMKKVFERGTKI